jgi:hypothetical protein
MKSWRLSLLLIALSGAPLYIDVFQFVHGGGLEWPMIWGNEKRFWSVALSPLLVFGIYISFSRRNFQPKVALASAIIAIVLIVPAFLDVYQLGFGASSKSDDEILRLSEFWISDWWS